MKMARVSLAPMGDSDGCGGSYRGNNSHLGTAPMPAMESTIDAYATRVLEFLSPPEACIDTSLGPYVTSLLRCEEQENMNDDITNLSEYDSLIELLQEHCTISRSDAEFALKSISEAVRTGIVPHQHQYNHHHGVADFPSLSGLNSMHVLGDSLCTSVTNNFKNVESEKSAADEEFPPLLPSKLSGESTNVISPLKPDNLIPVDLLGALDDPSVPEEEPIPPEKTASEVNHDSFPPMVKANRSIAGSNNISTDNSKKTPKKQSKTEAADLAASLFRPASRSRQASIDESVSSASVQKSRSSSFSHPVGNPEQYAPVVASNPAVLLSAMPTVAPTTVPNEQQYYSQTQEWEYALEIIHSLNPDLGEDAAAQAAAMTNMDINMAQFLIDSAMTAPPICRHLLNSGCYRSDCQFSHDIEGHTCVFWLKGRCGKGDSCRFLHGFNEKLLENTFLDPSVDMGHYNYSSSNKAFGGDIKQMTTMLPLSESAAMYHQPYRMESYPSMNHQNQGDASSSSFANVASQGYDQTCFQCPPPSHSSLGSTSGQSLAFAAAVKIPQDVWNPHEKRDSSAFHIIDPMERYRKVSTFCNRKDVIDLHFQSTKTFAMVLEEVLSSKLLEHESVWIVTGTGHHVGSKTHQKGGGVLENAVVTWLTQEGYDFCRGRDRNGHGGALLIKR